MSFRRQATVVTGGAGFVGQEVLRQLLTRGEDDVRVVDRDVSSLAYPSVRRFQRDVRTDELGEAFEGAEVVLHLAACQYHSPLAASTYDLPFFPVNVDGTRRVLEAARSAGAKRFVFVSTNMVYGYPDRMPLAESHPLRPFGPYGQSKLAAERLVEAAHSDSFQTAIVRPGLIIGPGRVGLIARIFGWVDRNLPILLIGGGNNRYEITASEDVASLVIATGDARGPHRAYNAGSAGVPTMAEWINAVIKEARSRSRIVALPSRLTKTALRALEAVKLSPLRKDQYAIADYDYFHSTEAARRDLGWAPKWTGLDAAMAAYAWYESTAAP